MQPCQHHSTPGGCRHGESCKFSHVSPAGQNITHANTQNALLNKENGKSPGNISQAQSHTSNENDQRFHQWRRIIPRELTDLNASFGHRLAKFFHLGLVLVGGDFGILQETVRLLASEGGLLSIRELVERHIPLCLSDAARIEPWRTCVRPLFAILTEQRVARSTLLEISTGAIYNAILGYNASRLQPLYDFLHTIADNWCKPIISNTDGQKSQFLELCTSILAKIVDCNTQTLVNDVIPPIVQGFKTSLDSLKSNESDFWILQAEKNIEYIQKRLSVVKGVAQPRPVAAHSISHATFALRRDLPGELSAEGSRHDNDHADCTKIRILPTMSEIMSARPDYRSYYDPSQLHLPGVQGLIDRHFRLLRDDMSAEKRGIRTHSYEISRITDVTCKRHHGLEFHLEIEQPFCPSPRSTMDCEEYWAMSRRLESGALVCVLQKATAIFCVVSESTVCPDPNRPKTRKIENGWTKRHLYSHREFSYVNLRLASPQAVDVEVMIRTFNSGLSSQRTLVEFPGILLPSFQSTLVALQQIYKTADLPFSDILAPSEDQPQEKTIPPPLYSTKPRFAFNLKSITNEGEDLLYSSQNPPDPELLTNKSQLDHGQAVACLNALRRSFQVIQGPPGTGKSWTGEAMLKVLLDNRSRAHIGPILCVCYTNHALDQLLEHLWHRGITQIIRIGSRSKSTLLEDVNLRKVARGVERTKAERQEAYKHGNKLTSVETKIRSCLDQMENATSAKAIKEYLPQCGQLTLHNAIFGAEAEEGWTKVTYKDENKSLDDWIGAGAATYDMPRPIDKQIIARRKMNSKLFTEKSICVFFPECQVIGVTTTGLAKNLELLRKLDSKVLLYLQDAAHLSDYPEVVGMRKRLFWFDHTNPESRADSTQPLSTSHTNDFEVEMVTAMVSHIVRQGVYAPDQIAVLTPYLGQLHKLRKRLRNSFEIVLGDRDIDELHRQGLKLNGESTEEIQKKSLENCLTLATVDNFQGEEAEVVVVSLHFAAETIALARTPVRGDAIRAKNVRLVRSPVKYNAITAAASVYDAVRRYAERFVLNQIIAKYYEIDLDEEPCIFPDCMHFLTVWSMDGQLGMHEHYDIADDGSISGIKESDDPTQLKSCPTCRGSLRNLSRYGRLVRQALLEESTKKFITWSHNKSMDFEKRLLEEQERLDNPKVGEEILATIGRPGQLSITGDRLRQLLAIAEWVGHDRYGPLIKLYREIAGYVHHVAIEEQPYQRVYDFVQHARRRGTGAGQFLLNPSKLETRGLLLAGSLLLRFDLLVLRDFVGLRQQADKKVTTMAIDLTVTFNDCNELVRLAREKKYVRHETEGHIYFIPFAALVRLLYLEKQPQTSQESKDMDRLKS
ncbi:hypothetical protein E0Z10_g2456 [Xylaria hypoxylon]|uniref:C3H1-type domain-containing protein n=1 Tax=Xylaria hypoxylon TaxID=37992 RepID=A0A4Z0ZA14_9PEZI|nr:hypothetical protein E0Z10_g2456 [Xylaria hypoxylon]